MLAHAYADLGDTEALGLLEELAKSHASEASALRARYLWRAGQLKGAAEALMSAFRGFRQDPWSLKDVVEQTFDVAGAISFRDPTLAKEMYASLDRPFALYVAEDLRKLTAVDLASILDPRSQAKAVEALEPHVPWEKKFLQLRLRVYHSTEHPFTARAQRDLAEFLRHAPQRFDEAFSSPSSR